MADILTPIARARIVPTGIDRGRPVLATTQWWDMAHGCNWLLGKGACLVPLYNPGASIATGVTHTFRFRTKPRGFSIRRVWGIRAVLADPDTEATISVRSPASTGTAVVYAVPSGASNSFFGVPRIPAQVYIQDLAARSSSEAEITMDITVTGGTVDIFGIDCYEADRPSLVNDATDYGILTETIRGGSPIAAIANQSIKGVTDAIGAFDARRVSLLQWAVDSSAEKLTRTSATPIAISDLPWKIQGPKLGTTDTTCAVKWAAYARMATSGGTGGAIALSLTSGDTDSVTVTGTSFGWTATRDLTIACDDFGQADGFEDDELTVTIAGDGTRAVEIASLSIWVETVA